MRKLQFWVVRKYKGGEFTLFGRSIPTHRIAEVVIENAEGEKIASFAPDMDGLPTS